MSLIVEDGTGVAGAESYCAVAFADAFQTARQNATWIGATADKEAALRLATDYMVENYRLRWRGSRTLLTQVLDWPRIGVQVPRDFGLLWGWGNASSWTGPWIPQNVVPNAVMQACAMLAARVIVIDSDTGAPTNLAPDLDRMTHSEKVGSLEVVYEPGATQVVQFRDVDMLLGPFLRGGANGLTLARA